VQLTAINADVKFAIAYMQMFTRKKKKERKTNYLFSAFNSFFFSKLLFMKV